MGNGILSGVRRRVGLPPRRRVGSLYLTIVAVLVVAVGVAVGSRSGPLDGLSAAMGVLLLPVLTIPVWLVTFGVGRSRLRWLRERLVLGSDSLAVRTTADFTAFPPSELSVIDSYTRPWTTYQLLTITHRRLELRTFPRKGSSGGALLRYDRIASIEVGIADFGDLRERAILISGTERGKDYTIAVVPVDEESLTLRPVNDSRFRDFADEIITEVEKTVAPKF
jgi:hypothetical protein